jgi:adenosylhomocysteine nucleosidase
VKRFWLFLITIALVSCNNQRYRPSECEALINETPKVYIATAFDIEENAVLTALGVDLASGDIPGICEANNGITYFTVEVPELEKTVVVFSTGVGTKMAEMTTVETARRMNIESLFFAGIAGRIDPELEIGSVVVAKTWYMLPSSDHEDVDLQLLELSKTVEGATFTETGSTSEIYVSDTQYANWIWNSYHASTVDMETYTIAAVANGYEIPFLAIRTVSDFSDGTETRENYKIAAEKSAEYLAKLLNAYFKTP